MPLCLPSLTLPASGVQDGNVWLTARPVPGTGEVAARVPLLIALPRIWPHATHSQFVRLAGATKSEQGMHTKFVAAAVCLYPPMMVEQQLGPARYSAEAAATFLALCYTEEPTLLAEAALGSKASASSGCCACLAPLRAYRSGRRQRGALADMAATACLALLSANEPHACRIASGQLSLQQGQPLKMLRGCEPHTSRCRPPALHQRRLLLNSWRLHGSRLLPGSAVCS